MCMSFNDPETSEIVFATSNVAARRIHTNSQGTDFADAQITRKKEFDQYAPGPVPPKALLYDGWWFDCTGCGRTLNLSDDDMWVDGDDRSEEHTSELQSLMRISYAVFCLKKKKKHKQYYTTY